MAERAVFLDRDNTILFDEGYLSDPSKVRLLQGAATAIASMRRLGYRVIVASNQSGVARGYFDEAAVETVNQEMCRQLREQAGAHIDASYYCPFHPDGIIPEYKMEHEWRKPRPGMLLQAAKDFDLDLSQSWMIGDMPRDVAAGLNAGCRTILLQDPDHPAADERGTLDVTPHFIVKNLADAARILAREGRNLSRDLIPVTPVQSPMETPAEVHEHEQETGHEPQVAVTPSPVPVAPVAVAMPAAPSIAPEELIERLYQKLQDSRPPAAVVSNHSELRPVLEEILSQLRHMNRVQEMPEFSKKRLMGVLFQGMVVICLLMGLWGAVTSMSQTDPSWWYFQTAQLLRSGLWLLAGVIFQGMALATKR